MPHIVAFSGAQRASSLSVQSSPTSKATPAKVLSECENFNTRRRSRLKLLRDERAGLNSRTMIRFYALFYALLMANCWINGVEAEQHPADDNGPLSEVQTAVGLEVALPCDLMPGTMIADKVQLVIWYKQGNLKPIYTFDARGRPLQQAIPWADEVVFKNKAHFYYDTNPPALRIKNIQTADAGLYKCRVDFHKSPTRNWRINMTVLVPPTQLTILDTYGAAVRDNMAGPYFEGENINLTCLSSGGIPPPRVSWWKEHALVDDSFQVLPDGTVRNIMHLKNIARRDLLTVFTCQASNGHVVAALSGKVKLDMNLPPLSLLLQGINHPLVAGVRTHVTCTSIGARPAPQIAWTKGGTIMRGATQSTSSDGNTTISELVLIPVPEDNERQVVCTVAMNPATTSQQLREGHTTVVTTSSSGTGLYLKDSRTLNVTHAPIVSLNLGAPLDPNNLMKGSDVYLECDIKANPGISRVEWYHNDKQLHSSRGIIISNQTLVLQGISKSSHGQYFCRATNIQGSVSSNEVYLDVKYPPVCKSDSTIIRAAIKQTINISCQVDSNPLDNLTYKWHFNNSLESLIELPSSTSTPSTMPLVGLPLALQSSGFHQHARKHHMHKEMPDRDGQQQQLLQQQQPKFISSSSSSSSSIGVIGRHGRIASSASSAGWGVVHHFEGDGDDDDNDDEQEDYEDSPPYTQMVYSNMVYRNHLEKTNRKYNSPLQPIQQIGGVGGVTGGLEHIVSPHQLQERKRLAALQAHKQQHHRGGTIVTSTSPAPPLNNVYRYHVESYENFGAVSCVASNSMGQSQPCWYHIQQADLPDPVKNCTAYNATANSIQIECIPGYDGGIQQHFHVQIYDELQRQILYNTSYKHAEFTIKRLPSDSVFVIRVTAVNLQGPSKVAFRLRGRTLSAPLLRTASSTAVLVQLTPLLGALVGVIATLILVAICIVIFVKFRTKRTRHSNGDATSTEADKGSAEPLSRNMGSHSSLEDKNPDVVPQETNSEDEFHLEEKAFDRLNMDAQRILYTPPTRLNSTSPPPPPLSPTFAKQYGELSLTTNPAFNLYNTPQRAPAQQRPVYTAPPPLLSTRTPPNIYTRIPGRTYLPAYETRTSPTSPYGSTTTCTMPLLSQQLQQASMSSQQHLPISGSVVSSPAATANATVSIGASHSLLATSPHQQQQNFQQQQSSIHLSSLTNSLSSGILGVVGNNYDTVSS